MESGALELMLIYNQTLHPTALPIINRRIACDYHQTTTWRMWPRKIKFWCRQKWDFPKKIVPRPRPTNKQARYMWVHLMGVYVHPLDWVKTVGHKGTRGFWAGWYCRIVKFSSSKKMTNWCAQNIQGMFKVKKFFQLLIAPMSNLGTHFCHPEI